MILSISDELEEALDDLRQERLRWTRIVDGLSKNGTVAQRVLSTAILKLDDPLRKELRKDTGTARESLLPSIGTEANADIGVLSLDPSAYNVKSEEHPVVYMPLVFQYFNYDPFREFAAGAAAEILPAELLTQIEITSSRS